MKRIILLLLCAIALMTPAWADSANLSPQEAYERIFSCSADQIGKYLSKDFLNVISPERTVELAKIYVDALGTYKKAVTTESGYRLKFDKGEADSKITINADNQISSLWFGSPELTGDSFEKVKASFKALPGEVAICLLRHSQTKDSAEEVFTLNENKPLGCGSTFKLYLLKALADSIKKKERNWSDIVELREDWKSFPSGILQDWPAGSKHTLETVAGLMITLSDNTATNHIYNMIGSEKLREYFPASCVDLYNTGQMLKLKFMFPDKAQEYLKTDIAGKKNIIKEMDAIITSKIASYSVIYSINTPVLIEEMEWFLSPRALCETIYSLRDNHLLRINPARGLISAKDWHLVGYKGGGEPGVLNYTWVLQKEPDSSFYTLSVSLNNAAKAVDETGFNMATTRLLKLVSELE